MLQKTMRRVQLHMIHGNIKIKTSFSSDFFFVFKMAEGLFQDGGQNCNNFLPT